MSFSRQCFPPVDSLLRLCEQQLNSQQKKPKHHLNHVQSGSSSSLQTPADSHVWSVNGWLEGQNKEQSERAGRGTGGGGSGDGGGEGVDGVTTNLLQFTDTKEKEERKGRRGEEDEEEEQESNTTPAILFLSSAATAFVAMTTQADDLIAVAFECCSLKEPVTQDRKPTDATQTRTDCYMRRKHSCIAAENLTSFSVLCKTQLHKQHQVLILKNTSL